MIVKNCRLFVFIISMSIIISPLSINGSCIISWQRSYSQINNPAAYKVFTNFDHNVSIQYPSGWIKNEIPNGRNFATFWSPTLDAKYYAASFTRGFEKTPLTLDLNSILKNTITNWKSMSGFKHFHVIESGTNYNLAGHPAYKIVATYTYAPTKIKFTLIQLGILVDNHLYYIFARVHTNHFSPYLPIINYVMNSFRIIKDDSANPSSSLNTKISIPSVTMSSKNLSLNNHNNNETTFYQDTDKSIKLTNDINYSDPENGISFQYPPYWSIFNINKTASTVSLVHANMDQDY